MAVNMDEHKTARRSVIAAFTILLLTAMHGCRDYSNLNNEPVSYWLNDADSCIRDTAKAIINSGRPFPNEIRDSHGKIERKDFWIGSQLYELPGWFPIEVSDFLPKSHPLRLKMVFGNADYILKRTPQKFADSRVGGSLYGSVRCYSNSPKETWIVNTVPIASTRAGLLDSITRKLQKDPRVTSVERQVRSDIDMMEVRVSKDQASTGAYYIPIKRNLTQRIDEEFVVKPIMCSRPYDPSAQMSSSELCTTWFYLGPGLWIEISVYQQELSILPDLHDKLMQTLIESRRI